MYKNLENKIEEYQTEVKSYLKKRKHFVEMLENEMKNASSEFTEIFVAANNATNKEDIIKVIEEMDQNIKFLKAFSDRIKETEAACFKEQAF